MSAKKQETITHQILQKSTGKKIGWARIFPQYKDMEVKDMKGGGYKLVWWQQLFIYYLLRWRVQCTHYTPVAEEQTYSVI